ncbi:nitrite reductase small subunit NirD [Rhodococcoides corynebacterioides]|uniref:Nitrite reductase small subunit NirD n=1 Tax=Rhodococcoides corynebacterioides TaxID=53972 RepID=A0ABS7P417_9NOCA|nr:nitrite reductase small subunit NirD [Rhodococcus corynebacterioides]MBY6365946.1 nitrite reductase small subunit NirD [Rhodococcus corynebacterioides]MBY6408589.1 nitrite reductase small subunit NirD [Rhodococcus corynebacterioides]
MTVIDTRPLAAPLDPRLDEDWVPAARLTFLVPGRGAAVLLPDRRQVAIFRLDDDSVYAVDNLDPFGRAAVMSRGLVGDRAGEPTVASPLLKQVFSLVDGRCLDEPEVRLDTYDVQVRDGLVVVAPRPRLDRSTGTEHLTP